MNLRPLGYEPLAAKPPGTARDDQAHFYWVICGRGATPDHPKPRTIVPDLSPRNRRFPASTFAPWLPASVRCRPRMSICQPPTVPISISTRRRPTSTIHDFGRGASEGSYARPNPGSSVPGRTPCRVRHSKPQTPPPVSQGTSCRFQPAGVETRKAAGRTWPENRTTTRDAGQSGPVDRFWRIYLTSLTRENVPPISNQASQPAGDGVPASSGEAALRLSAHAATATIRRIGHRENAAFASIVNLEIGLTNRRPTSISRPVCETRRKPEARRDAVARVRTRNRRQS